MEKSSTTKATIVVGSWSIHAIPLQRDVIVRSLLWPGYFMYYSDTGKDYGSGYFGMGEKNKDIAFCVPWKTKNQATKVSSKSWNLFLIVCGWIKGFVNFLFLNMKNCDQILHLYCNNGDQETTKVLFENKNFDAFYTQEVIIDKHKSMK